METISDTNNNVETATANNDNMTEIIEWINNNQEPSCSGGVCPIAHSDEEESCDGEECEEDGECECKKECEEACGQSEEEEDEEDLNMYVVIQDGLPVKYHSNRAIAISHMNTLVSDRVIELMSTYNVNTDRKEEDYIEITGVHKNAFLRWTRVLGTYMVVSVPVIGIDC